MIHSPEKGQPKPVNYIVESWPAWAQRDFYLRFFVNYFPRYILAQLRGQGEHFEEKKPWAEPIYDRVYQQVLSQDKASHFKPQK